MIIRNLNHQKEEGGSFDFLCSLPKPINPQCSSPPYSYSYSHYFLLLITTPSLLTRPIHGWAIHQGL